MKKIILFLAAFCFIQSVAFSQMKEYANEIKLNVLTSLLLCPEINYERVKTDYFETPESFGFGLSVAASFLGSDPESDFSKIIAQIYGKYRIIPYCRFYFGKSDEFFYHTALKRPNLFFIEINAAVIGGYGYHDSYDNDDDNGFENRTLFGLGLAVGKKFKNSKNLAEMYLGVGGGNSDFKSIDFYLRLGVNLGRRF